MCKTFRWRVIARPQKCGCYERTLVRREYSCLWITATVSQRHKHPLSNPLTTPAGASRGVVVEREPLGLATFSINRRESLSFLLEDAAAAESVAVCAAALFVVSLISCVGPFFFFFLSCQIHPFELKKRGSLLSVTTYLRDPTVLWCLAALLKQNGTNIRPTSWYKQPSLSRSNWRCNVRMCVCCWNAFLKGQHSILMEPGGCSGLGVTKRGRCTLYFVFLVHVRWLVHHLLPSF